MIKLSNVPTRGTSNEAQYVAGKIDEGKRRLQNLRSVGFGATLVFDELASIAEECRDQNWDGFRADPVTRDAARNARAFLEALPLGTPAPSVGAEPDGHLTLEWHRSPRRTLSVSVGPEGDLHYAALLGPNRAYGTEAFFGDVPDAIVELIRRVIPHD